MSIYDDEDTVNTERVERTATPREVKRYRVSPTRGLVEDDGGIYPIGVSQPMVLASAFDDMDRERMLAQGWGESVLAKLEETYALVSQLRAQLLANRPVLVDSLLILRAMDTTPHYRVSLSILRKLCNEIVAAMDAIDLSTAATAATADATDEKKGEG